MKKIISLLTIAVLTACSPVNQINAENQTTKSEVKPSVMPSVVVSQNPITQEVKTPEIVVSTSPKAEAKVNSELEKVLMNSLKSEISKLSDPVSEPISIPNPTSIPNSANSANDTLNGHTTVNSGSTTSSGSVIDNREIIRIDPISPDLRNANIRIIFKDEYKVRLKWMPSELVSYDDPRRNILIDDFISLNNQEPDLIKKINSIVQKYNVDRIFSIGADDSEENYENHDKELEKIIGRDAINFRSIYRFVLKDTDVKAFVDELRANKLVREANNDLPPVGM